MAAPFIFGKLPAHGDFVARGLSPAAERLWDDWASAEIDAAREALGEDFNSAHDAAPPWGFVSGPGALGETWRCGAIAASVDSAGRRFVVVAGTDGLAGSEAAFLGLSRMRAAEAAIRTMLVEGLEVEAGLALLTDDGEPDARAAAGLLDAKPTASAWWSVGDLVPPATGDTPPAGIVTSAIERVAALLKDAA